MRAMFWAFVAIVVISIGANLYLNRSGVFDPGTTSDAVRLDG